eukprot:TRINITY_DN3845_c0_g1_i2.p1 TRINITY_DN3845_c0_g1~~TRINITY_DN3845_c0_g1_i2.p1  ORF type:complete len:367 (-),score=94.90 TRINITY_DN3845_c0_g1_i2:330-1298(-)
MLRSLVGSEMCIIYRYLSLSYVFDIPAIVASGSMLALKMLNPGWMPRVLMIVPSYFDLTLRGALRMWVRHGFKLSLMLLALCYMSATLSSANRDDPYTIVGASISSTTKEVRKACRHKSREFHPDKHPGREEEVRPEFERIARACKLLSDPKKKSKYDKYGIVETDETLAPEASMSPTSHLSWFSSLLFYGTLGLGLPVSMVYNFAHLCKGKEDCINTATRTAQSLHRDMLALYKYQHLGSATLDCAEMYLRLCKWELDDQQQIVKGVGSTRSAKLASLANAHSERLALWLKRAKPDDQKVVSANKKLEQDWFVLSSKAKSS